MIIAKNNLSAREFRGRRKRMYAEEYVDGMSDLIAKELREEGNCSVLVEIVDNIRESGLYQDVQAIVFAAIKLSEQMRRIDEQRKKSEDAFNRALTDLQYTMERMQADYKRELQRVRTEHERINAEAVAIRRQAQIDAQRIREEAEEEKRSLLAGVRERIEQERASCLEAAKREAGMERERMLEESRRLAHDVYRELQDRFVPDAVSNAINGYRREDSAAYAAAAEQNRRAVGAFENARTTFSAGMTGLQAQMNEQLSEMQTCLSRSMMDWREQLYRLETMDLAQCAVNLSTIISGVDKRVGDAAVQGDQHTAESLSAVRRNLSRFEKQFRNALTAVGLEVYQPQPGDDFDPARHVLGEAEKDVDPDQPLTVSGCIRPGVLGSSGSGVEALIRAEVAAREKIVPQPPAAEPSFRPLFNQIIPGGDQA